MKKIYSQTLLPIVCLMMASSASADYNSLPAFPEGECITDPIPGATPEIYIKSGLGFLSVSGELIVLPSDGSLTKVLRDGNDIYIGKEFSWFNMPGWLKGSVSDNKATFEFPQVIDSYWEDINGVMTQTNYYAVVCEMQQLGMTADMVPTSAQTYTFTFAEDGSLIPENEELFIAEFTHLDNQWDWTLRGDYYYSLTRQTEKPLTPPEGTVFSPMTLTYPHLVLDGELANPVQLAISGDEVYLKGMAIGISDLPDATIKGEINDNIITFNSNQFLGNSELFGFTQYFIAGDWDEESALGFEPRDKLYFQYDKETNTLTSDMSFVIVPALQEDPSDLYMENVYTNPEIFPTNPDLTIKKLRTPKLVNYYPADEYYPLEVDFMVSMLSEDNQYIDLNKLYYEIWDAESIFTFNPSVYNALKEPTTQVPFGLNDYITFVCQDKIVQLLVLPDYKENVMRLRLVYKEEGKEDVYSDFLMVFDQSGVELTQDNLPVSVSYIDLQGKRVVKPEKGLYIRSITLPDGSQRNEKVIVK